jgi:hypothetical protein
MESDNGKPPIDSVRQVQTITRSREKIDIEIKEIIRAYPEDIARIIQSFSDWARQFDL